MSEVVIQDEIEKLQEDLDNRNREFAVLNTVIDYLSDRDDEKDPSPEFKKQKDYGFICDLTVLLCPLHPLLVHWLSDGDNMRDVLSKYLCDEVDVRGDYTQEKCLDNLKVFPVAKKLQYQDLQRKVDKLAHAKQ